MTKYKAVIFDVGGVILPQPQKYIASYGAKLGLSSRFLPELFLQDNGAFHKLECGQLTLNEFHLQFESEAIAKAKNENFTLPKNFSIKDLFAGFSTHKGKNPPINVAMLAASTQLRKFGISTCVLTNNWIQDDEKQKEDMSNFMKLMKLFFSEVIESAHVGIRKPNFSIYELACHNLGVKPSECIFLDDLGINLKAARAIGIKTIKVADPDEALRKLEELTGVSIGVDNRMNVYPAPCDPAKAVHGYVEVKKDIKLHFVESGSGPAVILLHGFPDLWYCWRHQISALAAAGFRAIALDQRGFGESSSPPDISDFRHEELCKDVITVMDRLGISLATVVGHDWGGALAWNLALKYPDRFRGVCGVNTPFFKINPDRSPMKSMYKNPGVFDYQLYFQEPGVAEKELEANVTRTMTLFFQGYQPKSGKTFAPSDVRERGGVFVGIPNMPRSHFLTEKDLEYYANAFGRSGFRGPLNWYRNYDNNWEWMRSIAHRKITIPALMVTASHDPVLKPSFSYGMEENVINLKRLHIERCSHWTPQERPYELNEGLIKWLNEIHSTCLSAKL